MRLVVASNNRGKLIEIEAALSQVPLELVSIADLVPGFDVEETGATFLENARLKALAANAATGLPCVADDSGLCVQGLGLEPGVRSSRYAGEGKTDADRTAYLLDKMANLSDPDRDAYFACVVFAVLPEKMVRDAPGITIHRVPGLPEDLVGVSTEGRVTGRIGRSPIGDQGFGYDPIFHPDADPPRTLAQFSMTEKNDISHRGKAFKKLAACVSH